MPVKYAEVIDDLSKLRLKTYRTHLTEAEHGLTTAQAVKAYFLLNDISQHFFVPMQLVEVVFRNRLNDHLKATRKNPHWYKTVPATETSRRLVENAIGQAQREKESPKPAADDVICRLTFGFWTHLLDAPHCDAARQDHFIWDQHTFRSLFPGAPADIGLGKVRRRLQDLNKLRNRLFHHEPIWRSDRVNSVETAITEMQSKYDDLLEILGWFSPEKLDLLKAWSFHGRLAKAADAERFDRALW